MSSPLHRIREFYGSDERVSDWLLVDQELINQFAESTRDLDWIHVDPERASRDGPFGGTIAPGFWTMSMLTYFLRQMTGCHYPAGAVFGFNYGFDRLRLTTPIRVGQRIRAASRLVDVVDRSEGRYLVKTENRVEIEGESKPAMVADWLIMLVYEE